MSASRIPTHLAPVNHPVQSADRPVGITSRPEPKGAVKKVLLVDGFQHVAHGTLDHLVLECRNPDRSRPPSVFGDVHSSDRLVSIPLRPEPLVQVLEIALQVLPVLVLGDAIHPNRSVLPDAPVGGLQRGHIQQMCQ